MVGLKNGNSGVCLRVEMNRFVHRLRTALIDNSFLFVTSKAISSRQFHFSCPSKRNSPWMRADGQEKWNCLDEIALSELLGNAHVERLMIGHSNAGVQSNRFDNTGGNPINRSLVSPNGDNNGAVFVMPVTDQRRLETKAVAGKSCTNL
jgi:hypothetical protein